MKRISIAELSPGMIAAENVISHDSHTVVPKGTVFTENIIARLENYYIYYVNIEENKVSDLSCPLTSHKADTDLMNVQNTPKESSCFMNAFKRCSEHFRAVLTGSISKNEPFSSDALLREVLSLLQQDNKSGNILDLFLNMRNTDNSVYSHCICVALISNMLSQWLGFPKNERVIAAACGLFHDCGLLMLPWGIVEKSRKYTHEEWHIIKTHPIEGFHLLSRYQSIPESVRDTALTHHERCDGSGYPYGLKSDELSRFTKVIMIADIFDAMISDKSYRLTMCPLSLIKYFEDDGIRKYDTEYVLTFLEHILNHYLKQKVTLHSGMDGNVIFISQDGFPRPAVRTESSKDRVLQEDYYNSILLLSNMENLSIESII